MKSFFILLLISLSTSILYGQASQNDIQLAQYYFAQGDYSVASNYYEKVYKKDQSKRYFLRYLECLEQTNEIQKAFNLFKKQVKKFPNDVELKLEWAEFHITHEQRKKGEVIIKKIIDDIPSIFEDYSLVINNLIRIKEFDFALELIKKGEQVFDKLFQPERAKINLLLNQKEQAIEDILKMADSKKNNVFENFSFDIDEVTKQLNQLFRIQNSSDKDYALLESILISKIQKASKSLNYLQILNWLYLQSSEFEKALKTAVAIDLRSNKKGGVIYELAKSCMESEAYKIAVQAFRYLIDEETEYIYEGQEGVLKAGYKQITEKRAFTTEEINNLLSDYERVLDLYGKNKRTIPIIMEYSYILAFYARETQKAINVLKNGLEINGLSLSQKAEIKMSLGNTYVVTGDIWEASLLYSQVEKDFKFEEIGDLAKFKNAKVFYFDGEFEYAQSQLDVLKGSTSKLISNDAIQLAIIISDNFGLDSNYQVMNWYANAELLIEQHKFDEAISLFDSISTSFPNHGLGDEILYQKGKIMESIGKWESACNYYNSLISNYGFDIMADDAMFRLGMIQEKQLNKPQEAIATYKKIMLNYKDSLFCSEARKRVRLLRGDFISDPDL